MNEQDRFEGPVDRLVARFLESEQAQTDTDAFMAGLARRRARRRIVRLSVRVCAAAAVVLIAVGLMVNRWSAPVHPPVPAGEGVTLALPTDLVDALRSEVEAALQGARSSGAAAVNAGAAPLMELAEANAEASRGLHNLIDEAGSAVDRFLETTSPRSDSDPDQEGSEQWKL